MLSKQNVQHPELVVDELVLESAEREQARDHQDEAEEAEDRERRRVGTARPEDADDGRDKRNGQHDSTEGTLAHGYQSLCRHFRHAVERRLPGCVTVRIPAWASSN